MAHVSEANGLVRFPFEVELKLTTFGPLPVYKALFSIKRHSLEAL